MTRLVLIRHGQTHATNDPWFRGQVDVPLDDVGLAQAAATTERVVAGWAPHAVFSSPLVRARQTAELVAAPFGIQVRVHEGLTDINYGVWQGLRAHEVRTRWLKTLTVWNTRPHHAAIPGGENLSLVRTRVLRAVTEIVAAYPQETVIIVAHAVINRLIMLRALGWTYERFWDLPQKNCSLCVVDIDDLEAVSYQVVLMHDTSHL